METFRIINVGAIFSLFKLHFSNLTCFSISQCPNSAYYIPNFIGVDEEERLLRNVYNVPKPKWTQLAHRRLQNWGGIPHPKGMVAETIPEVLEN